MRVKRIDHIVLPVKDLEATCLFYERVLGMEARVMPNGRTSLHFGKQKINLHPVESEVEPRARMPTVGSIDPCFVIYGPISEAVDELEKLNVPIIEGPVERTGALGQMASVYVNDLDGNLVEVSSYKSGDSWVPILERNPPLEPFVSVLAMMRTRSRPSRRDIPQRWIRVGWGAYCASGIQQNSQSLASLTSDLERAMAR